MKHLKHINEYYRKADFIKQQIGKQATRDKRIDLQDDEDARNMRILKNIPTILDIERKFNLLYSNDNKRYKTPNKNVAKAKSVDVLRYINKLSNETNGEYDYGVKIVQMEDDGEYEIVIFDKNNNSDIKTSLDSASSLDNLDMKSSELPTPYIRPSKNVIPVYIQHRSPRLLYTLVHQSEDQEIIYFFNSRVSYDEYKLAIVGSMDYSDFMYIYGDIKPNKLRSEHLKTKFAEALIPINFEGIWGSNNKLYSLEYHYHL